MSRQMKEICVDFISSSIVIRQFDGWLWTATAGNAMRAGVVFCRPPRDRGQ